MCKLVNTYKTLTQKAVSVGKLFLKCLSSKYFRLTGHALSVATTQAAIMGEGRHRQHGNEWTCLYSIKTLFTNAQQISKT